MRLLPGTSVAHYRLLRHLGAGGMGEVFLAEDTRLNRQVAIKFLVSPADDGSRRRLLREARAAAALEHPSIVGIYEIGSDPAGGDFIVMPYVLGETLATALRRGPLPVARSLAIGAQIASALALAHHHGIVHRDLKPQNIILTPSGAPMLLDFGLAKHVDGSQAAGDAPTISQVTQAHALVGTSGYMAPEQLRGATVDPRSDLFALGCVLYECLTARRAFTGTSSADIVGQVLHVDPAPPSSIREDADGQADALIARLLQKLPADRFQSADEVLGAIRVIETARASHGSGAVPISAARTIPPWPATGVTRTATVENWIRSRPLHSLAAAIVVVAALGFGLWRWQQPAGLPQPLPAVLPWFNRALDAVREGSYTTAQNNLEEAIRLDRNFALAYVRLAEAYSELDRLADAKDALIDVGRLVPNRDQLETDDALRLRAVENYVRRNHDEAIAAYRELAERSQNDPRGWVDLARAEDNAGRRVAAREHLEKARDLDPQYAPARVRLGTLLGQLTLLDAAVAEFDEAIRIYRAAGNAEGVAEAMVRRGTALTSGGRYAVARATVDEALALTGEPRFAYQRVRAEFDRARLISIEGQLTDGIAIAAKAAAEAKAAGLPSSAAFGLLEVGTLLIFLGRFDEAETHLTEAITLARQSKAERAEMLATLQLASLRNEQDRYQDALTVSEAPVKYFEEQSYPRNLAEAQVIRARSHEGLEEYARAEVLTRSALTIAEANSDAALIAPALENLVGQLEILGRLPDALRERERAERIYRSQGNHRSLAYSLVNHANLLSRLGRGAEAMPFLDELDRQIASGADAYQSRKTPGKLARALAASTSGQYDAVAEPAADAQVEARAKGAGGSAAFNAAMARVLAEHAGARLGRSRVPGSAVASWTAEAASTASRLDLSYWVASTLIVRGDARRAADVALAALALPGAKIRPELYWRVTLVAAAALARIADPRSATIRASADATLDELRKTWDSKALSTYLARADLAGLSLRQGSQ